MYLGWFLRAVDKVTKYGNCKWLEFTYLIIERLNIDRYTYNSIGKGLILPIVIYHCACNQ